MWNIWKETLCRCQKTYTTQKKDYKNDKERNKMKENSLESEIKGIEKTDENEILEKKWS